MKRKQVPAMGWEDAAAAAATASVPVSVAQVSRLVRLDAIRRGHNARTEFTSDGLEELAASIDEQGLLAPLLVERSKGGFALVAGERRWRALNLLVERGKLAHDGEVPVVVGSWSADERAIVGLVENLQREGLAFTDEVRELVRLREETGWSAREIARRLGKSSAWVDQRLRAGGFGGEAAQAVARGEVGAEVARELAAVDPSKRDDTLKAARVHAGGAERLRVEHVRRARAETSGEADGQQVERARRLLVARLESEIVVGLETSDGAGRAALLAWASGVEAGATEGPRELVELLGVIVGRGAR